MASLERLTYDQPNDSVAVWPLMADPQSLHRGSQMSQRYGAASRIANAVVGATLAWALGLTPTASAQAQSTNDSAIYLNQGWSQGDRDWYYQFSQGSAVI